MDAAERRLTRRHPATENRARLEWAESGDFRETTARLIDISQGGAGFVAESPPPVGAVWLRLETPRRTGWVSARVVRLDGPAEGGLRFSSFCPHEMMAGLA